MQVLNTLIPRNHFYIAVSGGKDSMTFLKYLEQFKNNMFSVLYFNHGTSHGRDAEIFLRNYCENKHELIVGHISSEKPKGISQEEHWRNERYAFFDKYDGVIITGHHLNDVMETWVFTSLHGTSKLIPKVRGKYQRPFLTASRAEIDGFAERYKVDWVEDFSNSDVKHRRNFIRHVLLPNALVINPGLGTLLRKMIKNIV